MAEIYILNCAVNILKNECSKNEKCNTCPFYSEVMHCLLNGEPNKWKFLDEKQ